MNSWLKDDLASRKTVIHRAMLFSTVTLFVLFIFQPFGTNNHNIPFKFLRLSGYGLVTFCALLLSGVLEIALTRLKIKNRYRLMLIPFIYIVITSVFNHSYFVVAIIGIWYWKNQLLFVFYTFAIGLFPIFFMYSVNYHAKKARVQPTAITTENTKDISNEALTNNENLSPQLITLTGDNKSDNLQISISQILFIKSADNYCELTLIKDNNISHHLLRSSLTSILKQLPEKSLIYRCHRSYAVNLALVDLTTGNTSGLKLIMKPIGITVPVSRSYVETIKKALSLIPEAC